MKFHFTLLPSRPPFSELSHSEERVRVVAVDVDLGEQRERDAEVALAEALDLGLVPGLLVAELVAREAEHGEALVGVLVLQLLQALVLRREAALRGGVDDEHHLPVVRREVDLGAVDAGGREVGEVRHGRSLPESGDRSQWPGGRSRCGLRHVWSSTGPDTVLTCRSSLRSWSGLLSFVLLVPTLMVAVLVSGLSPRDRDVVRRGVRAPGPAAGGRRGSDVRRGAPAPSGPPGR